MTGGTAGAWRRVAAFIVTATSVLMLVACSAKENPSDNEVIIEWRDGEVSLIVSVSYVYCTEQRPRITAEGELTTQREPAAIDALVLLDGAVVEVLPAIAPEDYVLQGDELVAPLQLQYSPPIGEHSVQFCLEERADPAVVESELSSESVCLILREYSTQCELEDEVHPSISAQQRPDPNEYGWYQGPVTVSFVCEDAESGVAECPDPVLVSGEWAAWELDAVASDYAGNDTTIVAGPVRIDLTPPTITFVGAREYLVDESIVVTCNIRDDLSGVLESVCSGISTEAYMLDLGTYPVSATAVDLAGNEIQGTAEYSVRATARSVCNVVRRFVSEQTVLVSLCSRLVNAEAAFGAGDAVTGNAELAAFHEQVDNEQDLAVPATHAGTLVRLSLGLRP